MSPDEILKTLTDGGMYSLDFPIMRVTAVSIMMTFSLALPHNERWIDAGKLESGRSLWVLAVHDAIDQIIENIVNPAASCSCSRCEHLNE